MSLIVYNASAGSGKTFTLAKKYISMAVQSGKPSGYSNILAVTFTNKATAEMKGRILSFLYSVSEKEFDTQFFKQLREDINKGLKLAGHAPISDETIAERAKSLLYAMMKDYDRFRVETIDSFFQSLLTNLAHELRLPRGFRVDLDDATTIAEAIDSLFANINESGNQPLLNRITSYIEHNIDDDQKWNIIKGLTQFAQSNLFSDGNANFEKWVESCIKSHNGEDWNKNMEAFYKEIGAYYKELREIKNGIEEKVLETVKELDELLILAQNTTLNGRKIGYVKTLSQNIKNSIFLTAAPSQAVMKIANDHEELFGKEKHQSEEAQQLARKISDIIHQLIYELNDEDKRYFTVSLILENLDDVCLLGAISHEVNRITHEKGTSLLSTTPKLFCDIVQKDDSSFVFERSGTTFHHVMIDEFQDTSRMQWNNFQKLLIETQAEGNESMLVGDVKQSIYGWRGGDWKILGKDIWAKKYHAQREPLSTNYRSLSNIVRFNNAFFVRAARLLDNEEVEDVTPFGTQEQDEMLKQLIKESSETENNLFANIYKDVVQTPNSDGKPENGYIRIQTFDKEEPDDTAIEALYEQIVALHDAPYKIPYDKMMILVRKKEECKKILDYFNLHHAGCDCMPTSDEALLYTSSSQTMTLVYALKCLNDSSDKISQCMLERYVNESCLSNEERVKVLADFRAIIENSETKQMWKQMPLYKLCRDLIELFRFEEIDAASDQKQSSYLFNFMDAVTQYLELNPSDLNAFIDFWDTSLINKSISAGLKGKPYITTIHKSKGLEGHTIFIPFAAFRLERDSSNSYMWCDIRNIETTDSAIANEVSKVPVVPIKTLASKKVEKSIFYDDYEENHLQQRIENVNALYVAFTRARCNLFIWAKSPTTKKNSSTFLSNSFHLIDSFVDGNGGEIRPTEKEWGEIVPYHDKVGSDEGKCQDEAVTQAMQNPFEERTYPSQAIQMKSGHLQTVSFRQSNKAQEFIDTSSDSLTETEKKKLEYLTRGLLYHKLFSYIQRREDVDAAIDRLINEDHVILPNRREELHDYVENHMKENKHSEEWFGGNYKIYNEYNILTEEEGKIVEYRPDRVMEYDDKVVVVDYKFGKENKKHKTQVTNYMNHLNSIFPSKRIEGYLWYVDNNKVEPVSMTLY